MIVQLWGFRIVSFGITYLLSTDNQLAKSSTDHSLHMRLEANPFSPPLNMPAILVEPLQGLYTNYGMP